jgi:hypothetical protein
MLNAEMAPVDGQTTDKLARVATVAPAVVELLVGTAEKKGTGFVVNTNTSVCAGT